MFFNVLKNKLVGLLIVILFSPITVFAYSDHLIPGGQSVGIEIETTGVMVVGMYNVGRSSPGKDAGLRLGDVIVEIENTEVDDIEDMVDAVSSSDDATIEVAYTRNGDNKSTSLRLVKHSDGTYKTGLYVKDSVTGVGTLTFIDPETKIYGVLGHEIIEKNTMKLVESYSGKIFKSTITGIEKSSAGNPGEKNAKFYSNSILGTVKENTIHGVFGRYTSKISQSETMEISQFDEIKLGPAKIRTVINGNEVKEFDINILKLNDTSKTKNILFEVTDNQLLVATAGIVQGMSGSPIIQNNKIIGAVTHVVVDDSKKGFGIHIINMLEEAEN